jgi:hypothetical protein
MPCAGGGCKKSRFLGEATASSGVSPAFGIGVAVLVGGAIGGLIGRKKDRPVTGAAVGGGVGLVLGALTVGAIAAAAGIGAAGKAPGVTTDAPSLATEVLQAAGATALVVPLVIAPKAPRAAT